MARLHMLSCVPVYLSIQSLGDSSKEVADFQSIQEPSETTGWLEWCKHWLNAEIYTVTEPTALLGLLDEVETEDVEQNLNVSGIDGTIYTANRLLGKYLFHLTGTMV